METLDFTINGRLYSAEETEGMYSIVADATFIGQMYRESNGWSWEITDESSDHPWKQIADKIEKHLENLENKS